jgi:hypothetical protein
MPEQISSNDLSWLDWKNEIQMKWALNHFSKKGFVVMRPWAIEDAPNSLRAWLEEKQSDAETELLLAKARNAWRQQKHRKQKAGHKAYNFVLPTEVQATLKQLARMRKTNMTEALKELIGEVFEEEKHHQRELRSLQEKHKQAQTRLTEKQKNAERQVKALAKSRGDHADTSRALAKEIRELLWHKVEQTLGNTRESVAPEDRTALDKRYAEELEKLKQRLPLQGRFDAFSSRPSQRATPHRTTRSESPPPQKSSSQ